MTTHNETNENILSHVEAIGGGYVWEAECLAVSLIDVPLSDSDVTRLRDLRGVEQIALNAAHLSFEALESVARTPDLQSLVLGKANLSDGQLAELRQLCPEIVLVSDET